MYVFMYIGKVDAFANSEILRNIFIESRAAAWRISQRLFQLHIWAEPGSYCGVLIWVDIFT